MIDQAAGPPSVISQTANYENAKSSSTVEKDKGGNFDASFGSGDYCVEDHLLSEQLISIRIQTPHQRPIIKELPISMYLLFVRFIIMKCVFWGGLRVYTAGLLTSATPPRDLLMICIKTYKTSVVTNFSSGCYVDLNGFRKFFTARCLVEAFGNDIC